ANVGDQFGESNKHLLSKMFGWFYFSINAGSFISSILCPWLLANPKYGPGWAFGIPGIAMVIATLFFWGGRNKMVHVPPAGLGYFVDPLSMAPCESEVWTGLGIWDSRHRDGDRHFVFLGWAQQNGPCPARRARLFKRNVQ